MKRHWFDVDTPADWRVKRRDYHVVHLVREHSNDELFVHRLRGSVPSTAAIHAGGDDGTVFVVRHQNESVSATDLYTETVEEKLSAKARIEEKMAELAADFSPD